MRGLRVQLLAFTVLTVLPLPAIAQETTDRGDVVIVTAQKRSEDIQDVPVAVTAISGEALQDQHVTNVLDLNALAPSLQVKTDDNAANPKIFIRGIGLNDFNPNTASAVAIYSDGVYIGSPLAQMGQFLDLDRVEVLRGPQGTLYGRNTTGGAINLISKRPGDKPDGSASIEYGAYNGLTAEFGFGAPLTSTLSYRAAGTYVVNDGYSLNRLTGNRGNDTDRASGRFSLAWTPSDTFDALFQLRYGRSKGGSIWAYNRSLLPQTAAATGPDGFCAPAFYTSGDCTDLAGYANTSTNLYQGDYHLEGKDSVETYGGSAILTWDLGSMSLVSVTGYDHADRDDLEDTDAGPNDIITARYRARQWAASQELRLQSNGDNRLNWVAGLYFARDELWSNSYYDVFRIANSGDPVTDAPQGIGVFSWPFTQDTDSYAVFGQIDYKVTDRLTATVGLRYSADDKSFHYDSLYSSDVGGPTFPLIPTTDDSKNFDSLSGRLGLQYEVNDDINVYASYNRGYKSGGFFGGQTTDPAMLQPYADEVVNAYEIGLKSRLLGDMLTANFAAFFYDYEDLQVYTLVVDPLTSLTVQNFTNASNAEVSGFEAELASSPLDGLDLSLSASFLDATYKDFNSAGTDYSGNTLPNAPEVSLNGSARYQWAFFGGDAEAQADVSYRSKVFYDTRNVERLSDGERTFVNLRLGWTPNEGGSEFGIWGRNVFGETNISDIIPIEGLGFDLFSVGPRQTAGVYARFNY
jgi:iron complex outermembrane receptor protein